jgi:hypothetical protein
LQVPPETQELDREGSVWDIVGDAGASGGVFELEMVVEDTALDWEGLVEDETLEEDKAWAVLDSLVELFRATGHGEIVDAAASCKLVEDKIELFWAGLWKIVDAAACCKLVEDKIELFWQELHR